MAGRREQGGRRPAAGGRVVIVFFSIALCTLLVWLAVAWVKLPQPLFPIRYVRVEGEISNLDGAKLREALAPAIGGGFFITDLKSIERVAKSFPWVDEAQVARYWPDTVVLTVKEQHAVARWGETAFLNPRGERFAPAGTLGFAELPMLSGPAGMESALMGMMKSLNEKLADKGMRVVSLNLSKRRAWTVRLSGGMEICFGRQDPMPALDRFLALIVRLGEDKLARLQRVDLRYPNGFAVVWRPETTGTGEGLEKAGA